MRPGSVTHQTDTEQRRIVLAFDTTEDGTSLNLQIPPVGANGVLPGYYLVIAIDASGRPSVGKWLRLD